MGEKRFVEDYNQDESHEEPEIDFDRLKSKEFDKKSEPEKNEESEELEESEDVQNIFEDNFGGFSPGFRSRASAVSASLESEPIQNLERGMQDQPSQQTERREEQEVPMMYNAPQYGSGYDAVGYPTRSEMTDVTGGASTANLGREINMKRWQETAMGYPKGPGGMQQGEQYVRAPEKQSEARGLPFERGNQRRNIGWKEEY
ncbi:MAG: hypothetical protein PHF67_04125 [Candidatus Nanoarchaeia archaeon]|nr:hypothetical protein [Candidatus Nanoarchaeia archaeon]